MTQTFAKLKLIVPVAMALRLSHPKLQLKAKLRFSGKLVAGNNVTITTVNGVTTIAATGGAASGIAGQVAVFLDNQNITAGGVLGSNAFTSTIYAPLANPVFTGGVAIGTTAGGVIAANSLNLVDLYNNGTGPTGTGAYVRSINPSINGLSLFGVNTAPTPAAGSNNTTIATTAYIDSKLGAASGIATLDGGGKLTSGQIPTSLIGALVYQGTWNASTNSPALVSGTGTKGWYYKVGTAGTTTVDGISQWNAGDSIVFDGTTWDKIDGVANEVISVAGLFGVITSAALKTAMSFVVGDLTDASANARTFMQAANYAAMKVLLSLGVADVAGAAPLANPALTGVPTAPTAANGTNTTQIATTAFVLANTSSATTRLLLTSARTFYVGANLGVATIATGSPANIGIPGHGLSVNDPVMLQIPLNTRVCTYANGTGTFTLNGHGFVNGQPISLQTSGYLAGGIAAGTTYYVVNATTNTFQIALTVGGAAITAAKQTWTFSGTTLTASAAHLLVQGQAFTVSNSGGALPSPLMANTPYYTLTTPSSTTLTFSATNGGSAITLSGGSGTQSLEQVGGDPVTDSATTFGSNVATHLCSTVGAFPTFSSGAVEGTKFYVGTVVNANAVTLSTTTGNANPVNASGTVTGSPVYTAWTGNDSNNGLAQTRSGALFSIQQAISLMTALDCGPYSVTIQVCDGTRNEFVVPKQFLTSGGSCTVQGNTAVPSNCFITTNNGGGTIQSNQAVSPTYVFTGFRLAGPGGYIVNLTNPSLTQMSNCEMATTNNYVNVTSTGTIFQLTGWLRLMGPCTGFTFRTGDGHSRISIASTRIAIFNVPNFGGGGFGSFVASTEMGYIAAYSVTTYSGSCRGQKGFAGNTALLNAGGSVSSLPGDATAGTGTQGQIE